MKLKRVTVRWEKAIEIEVFVPESMTDAEILVVAEDSDVDNWESEGWEPWISAVHHVELPEEHRRLATRFGHFGHQRSDVVLHSVLDVPDSLMISDDRDEFVSPVDATWWLAKEES